MRPLVIHAGCMHYLLDCRVRAHPAKRYRPRSSAHQCVAHSYSSKRTTFRSLSPKNLLSLSSYTVLLILEIVALLSPRTLSISPRTRPWIACARFLGRKFGLSGSHTDSLFERLRTARRSAQRSGAAGGGGAFAAVSNGEDCGGSAND